MSKCFQLASLVMVSSLVLIPHPLIAFNSAKWMEKREAMSDEAVRLQAAYSNCVARLTSLSEGITIPLETNPDGSVRTSVYAKKAQIFDDAPLVWAEDLVMTKLGDDGKERIRIDAERCVIDRVARTGWVDGHAKVTQGKTSFEGDSVFFSATNGFVTVYSKADMKSADLKLGGLR